MGLKLGITFLAMPYDIIEHKHRFSAWAASRAASTKTCRFDVCTGKRIIEDAGLRQYVHAPYGLPEAAKFDEAHRAWRELVINSARTEDLQFSHGIAAKLINCYLKAALVCGGYEAHPKVVCIHPPIDALLLDSLFKSRAGGVEATEVWAKTRRIRWTKLNSSQYEDAIRTLRIVAGAQALWQVEEHWRGFQ